MTANAIGSLNENPLHAALKSWYAGTDDRVEVPVDGYVIDVVQGERLVEIQTGHFSPLKQKLADLLERYPVRLVHPIARDKWIVKIDEDGETQLDRRKSPKHGGFFDVFAPLVSIPHLLHHPRFQLEILLVQVEEVRRYDASRAWRRRGWVIEERRLLQVLNRRRFDSPQDLAQLLPADLAEPFTTADLAKALKRSRNFAQRMAYCLRKMQAIVVVDKQGNALLYRQA